MPRKRKHTTRDKRVKDVKKSNEPLKDVKKSNEPLDALRPERSAALQQPCEISGEMVPHGHTIVRPDGSTWMCMNGEWQRTGHA